MEQNKVSVYFEDIEVTYSDHKYFIVKNNKTILLENDDELVFALPLLKNTDLQQLLPKNFPIDRLIRVGLQSKSDYWIEFALKQLKVHIALSGTDFRSELSNIVNDNSIAQYLRHQAKKIMYQNI